MGDKTVFITFESKHDRDNQRKLKITINDKVTITEDEVVKILRFQINRRNTMENHLNATASKIGMIMSKLKPALKYLTEKNRKEIILHKAETILMRINRQMTCNPLRLSS